MSNLQLMRTYEEWKSRGYIVTCGEKSYARNDSGAAVFDNSQVTKIEKPYTGTYMVTISNDELPTIVKSSCKIPTDNRVLCKCKTLADAELVSLGLNRLYSSLMW